jgi:mRNA interferase MazF
LPEFWKCRAVLIVSLRSTLYGAVTVLACSSDDQTGNKWAYKQATTIDGRADSWVICDKPTTVAVSRLSVDRTGVKFIPEREFNEVLALMYKGLPQVRGLET